MHSRIFQISEKPITEDNFIDEELAFNEELMDYCTADTHFDDDFSWLVSTLPQGTFEVSRNTLKLIDVKPLLDLWRAAVETAYEKLNGDMGDAMGRWRIKNALKMPLGGFLFFIEDYAGSYTTTSDDFIDWLLTLKPGDTIYFGATFDYHF